MDRSSDQLVEAWGTRDVGEMPALIPSGSLFSRSYHLNSQKVYSYTKLDFHLISCKSFLNSLEKWRMVTQHSQKDLLTNWRHFLHLFLAFSCLDNTISILLSLEYFMAFVLSFVSQLSLLIDIIFQMSRSNLKWLFFPLIWKMVFIFFWAPIFAKTWHVNGHYWSPPGYRSLFSGTAFLLNNPMLLRRCHPVPSTPRSNPGVSQLI